MFLKKNSYTRVQFKQKIITTLYSIRKQNLWEKRT